MTNICIIARGRHRLLAQTIDSLYANTDQKEFTCTVAHDDGPDEDFRVRRLLQWIERRNFQLISVRNSGHVLAQLKNLAVFQSRMRFGAGDWLYISDSDVCFLPGWLQKLTDCAQTSERYGFRLWGGQIHPFHHAVPPKEGGVNFCGSVLDVDGIRDCTWTEHSVLDGPSWLMRWRTWREVGPLSRTCAPGTCQSEDAEWCGRLTAPKNGGSYGYRIGVTSPHVVVHTGLTNSAGEDCVGRKERELMIPQGVLAE